MEGTWTTEYMGETFEYDRKKNHVWVEVVGLRNEVRELRSQMAELVHLLASERA